MDYKRRDIFLHFLNRDSRQIYGLFRDFESSPHSNLLERALNAAAILCESHCIAPPGFIIECDIAQGVMERKHAYLRERLIELPIREASLTDLIEKKRVEYAPMRGAYAGLFDDERVRFLDDNAQGIIPRKTVVGTNIAKRWSAGPDENKRLWRPILQTLPPAAIYYAREIPRRLIEDGIAATWPAIAASLADNAKSAEPHLRRVLQHDYFSLYVKEFSSVIIRNLPFMQDDFSLPSEAKVYDYEWLRTFFDQLMQRAILDADAETILLLRKQYGFIRCIDAYAGLCTHCKTITDLRFHVDRLARSVPFQWKQFSQFWNKIAATGEFALGEERAVELADALGDLAARIEIEFSFSMRMKLSDSRAATPKQTSPAIVRTNMNENPSLVIFVALEEEFKILKKRWNLQRAFVDFAARGNVANTTIDVVCANAMGRVPAAVAMGFYFGERKDDLPTLVLTVGLAGGFEEEKIEEGMIIIPDTVVDLATRKLIDTDDETKTEFRRRDFQLEKAVYNYLTSSDFDHEAWEKVAIAQADWPDHRRPSFHPGLITSLDEVVGSKKWQKSLLTQTPKLLGVEMEAGGVCAAAEAYKVPVAMIRAVSDKADPAKKDTQWRSRGMKTIATLVEAIQWPAIITKLKTRR